ncbi:HD-GYP domain-containing protein [Butyrivibrio sp. AE3004]|uniref:HD-GYP domain-containing protein n=1 Tax=Butyrivibrio sp. AE3004 TaxID=1506994 RepID=UPI00068F158F|nr:HD domain-containing phosphohydrolase [Butyrivibrio sp. AE3004]
MILMRKRDFNLLIFFIIVFVVLALITGYKHYKSKRRTVMLLELLIGIVEADNPNLDGHSLHVHNLTMLLYEFMPYFTKLKVNEMDLHYASLLLDIGKRGIPCQIMDRAGKLGQTDWDIIKKHPEIALEMMKDVPGFEKVFSYILYHHERMDGKGYHQLSGEQIPFGARMIAVTDTYSAITMNRSYRPSLSYAEAISELRMAAGTQLDEEIVNYFCNIPMKKIDACMEDVRNKMERFSDDRRGNT